MSSQEIVVFNSDFPSDATSVKFRAVQWICTEVMLALAVIWNLLPRLSQLALPLAAPADCITSSLFQMDIYSIRRRGHS